MVLALRFIFIQRNLRRGFDQTGSLWVTLGQTKRNIWEGVELYPLRMKSCICHSSWIPAKSLRE